MCLPILRQFRLLLDRCLHVKRLLLQVITVVAKHELVEGVAHLILELLKAVFSLCWSSLQLQLSSVMFELRVMTCSASYHCC